jgi:hypothetical protein
MLFEVWKTIRQSLFFKSISMLVRSYLSILVLLLISPVLLAFEVGHGDDWQWTISGFGTLGAVYSTNQNAGYLRDVTQARGASGFSVNTDTRLGLQTNFKWQELELVAQAVSRHRADNTYTPELMMAFAKIDPTDNMTLRGGRLLLDLYTLGDSRNIGYSYLTIRPPVEYLGWTFANYFDGGDLSYRLPLDDGFLSFKAYAGHVSEPVSMSGHSYSYEKWYAGHFLYGFQIDGQWEDWKARIGFLELKLGENPPTYERYIGSVLRVLPTPQALNVANDLTSKNRWVQYYNAALSWSPSPFTADLGLSVVASRQIAVVAPRLSGFLNLSYRIDDVTPFFAFSWTTPIGDNQVSRLPAGTLVTDAINSGITDAEQFYACNQRTFSLGLRYDFIKNVDAKFQIDFPSGSGNNNVLWEKRGNTNQFNGESVVFGATLDFVF